MTKYIPKEIETKWQKKWEKDELYKTPDKSQKPKFYCLDMFPYPSGEGLHVGHFKGYTATDIISRYLRMKGYDVLHPIGWDAFGLPTENYAIKTGIHPKITTKSAIDRIRDQMKIVGYSYDWLREINTTDTNYYKWTQWIFLQMYKKGLAYEAVVPINFCPSCKTGLANEEVIDGKCERCGTKVGKKDLRQWILKITAYADRLLADLDGLDWPESVIEMQKNWIGKSVGTEIEFPLMTTDHGLQTTKKNKRAVVSSQSTVSSIKVFTTRADTLFGASYLVLSPEHPLVFDLTTKKYHDKVHQYVNFTKTKTDLERLESKEKTGQFTGSYAINPVNNRSIPIWVADYVLMAYGTGAIMAVPAHDERDFDFAQKFKLPIKEVIKTDTNKSTLPKKAFVEYGTLVNSDRYDHLHSKEAIAKITADLERKKLGKKAISYKLRDWIFSRQRYWGEPIPILHCENCGTVPVREKDLPLTLPVIKRYQPTGTGESPLAAITDWVNTSCWKCGGSAKRETNTMPQWAGSCWYYLRYLDPKNNKRLVDPKKEKYWMAEGLAPTNPPAGGGGVDWYVGGAEHAVLHLLYSRFWHKFLHDIGVVSTKEPFAKLRNVGLVLGPDGQKMSKSRGNIITPDDICAKYGADTLRLYEGFMGPFNQIIVWDPASIEGVYRFLQRVWQLVEVRGQGLEVRVNKDKNKSNKNSLNDTGSLEVNDDNQLEIAINKLIKKVEEDVLEMKFNTAIAAMMEFVNLAFKMQDLLNKSTIKQFLLILAPFAPHITEELWQKLGETYSIHQNKWPRFDQKLISSPIVEVIVQVNGKLRDKLEIERGIDREKLEERVLNLEKIKKWTRDNPVKNIIVIENCLVNLVTK